MMRPFVFAALLLLVGCEKPAVTVCSTPKSCTIYLNTCTASNSCPINGATLGKLP